MKVEIKPVMREIRIDTNITSQSAVSETISALSQIMLLFEPGLLDFEINAISEWFHSQYSNRGLEDK